MSGESEQEYLQIGERMQTLFETHQDAARANVEITGRVIDWIAIHGVLQLALRHPDLGNDFARKVAERVIFRIEDIAKGLGLFDDEIVNYLRRSQEEGVEASRRAPESTGSNHQAPQGRKHK